MARPQQAVPVPIIIYCAWPFKSGAIVGLKFPSKIQRQAFQKQFKDKASQNDADFSRAFTTLEDAAHQEVLYINPSSYNPKNPKSKEAQGAYIAKNGELAIDFVKPELRDTFISMTNLKCCETPDKLENNDALAPPLGDKHANALYFNTEQLPAHYDPTHRHNIKTNWKKV